MQNIHKNIYTKYRNIFAVILAPLTVLTSDMFLNKLPVDLKLGKQWKIKLRIGKPIIKHIKVCSNIFLIEGFMAGN